MHNTEYGEVTGAKMVKARTLWLRQAAKTRIKKRLCMRQKQDKQMAVAEEDRKRNVVVNPLY